MAVPPNVKWQSNSNSDCHWTVKRSGSAGGNTVEVNNPLKLHMKLNPRTETETKFERTHDTVRLLHII